MTIDFATLLSIATVAILAIGALIAIMELKHLTDQQRLTVFTIYTDRYSRIAEKLPPDVYEESKSYFQTAGTAESAKLMVTMRRFFNLCSEEYFIKDRKLLESEVWRLWKKGMNDHMKQKSFQEAWNTIKKEGYDTDFVAFIDGLVPPTA